MDDAFDYMEIEEDTIKMRIFSQTLGGEAKKWFKILTPNSINNLPSLYQTFIKKWEVKKKPLQILQNIETSKKHWGKCPRLLH